LIYPSGRAVVLAAAASVPAFAIAVAVPAYWYAGLFAVAFIVALTLVDLAVSVPAKAMRARVDAPPGAYVGQDVEVVVSVPASAPRLQTAVGHDERLKPLPFRGGVGGGAGTAGKSSTDFESATPHPNPVRPVLGRPGDDLGRTPEGEGLFHRFAAIRRGPAMLETAWVRWAGPFGLIWRQSELRVDKAIAVIPDIRPARAEALRLFRRDMPIGETVQIDRGVGSEFQALAEFRAGMDRRAIDWKRSAHHSKLLAKEYRIERNNEIVFAVDCGRLMCEPVEGLPKVDRAVTAALSAAFVALKLGDKVSLFGFDSRPRVSSGAVAGAGSFGVFQNLAAQIDYSTDETNYTFALTTLGAKLVRRSFILIFTDFADPTSAELMLKSVGRLAQKHLILFVLMRDVELEEMIAAPPDDAKDVSRAVTAASLLRERRIVIARLQRLGVHVIEAPHARLGTDLVNAYLDMKRRDLV
jgi:uncharacterized protein (DUF58 family)